VKYVFRTIAVGVHQIQYGNTLQIVVLDSMCGTDGNIVKNAEPAAPERPA